MAYNYPLKQKCRTKPATKGTRTKTTGNGGGVGRRAKAEKRMHGGGHETSEQKAERERQSRQYTEWRKTWGVS